MFVFLGPDRKLNINYLIFIHNSFSISSVTRSSYISSFCFLFCEDKRIKETSQQQWQCQ